MLGIIGLLMFLTTTKDWRGKRELSLDDSLHILENPQSFGDLNVAQNDIMRRGEQCVPMLTLELARMTNVWAKGYIYNLICILDPITYQRMTVDYCQTNNPEVGILLVHANRDTLLLGLPAEKLSELTNAVCNAMANQTNRVTKANMRSFLSELGY
jgi:hypothetical protein